MPNKIIKETIKQVSQLQTNRKKPSQIQSFMDDLNNLNPRPILNKVTFKPIVYKFSEDNNNPLIVNYPNAREELNKVNLKVSLGAGSLGEIQLNQALSLYKDDNNLKNNSQFTTKDSSLCKEIIQFHRSASNLPCEPKVKSKKNKKTNTASGNLINTVENKLGDKINNFSVI